jgi:hypothetical protein
MPNGAGSSQTLLLETSSIMADSLISLLNHSSISLSRETAGADFLVAANQPEYAISIMQFPGKKAARPPKRI